MATAHDHKVVYRDATTSDLESMSTMVPRSYSPDASLSQIIPDTPKTRQWWVETYRHALSDPAARLLLAVDGEKTVGIFILHYLGPDSPSSSSSAITSVVPLIEDHSPILAEALKDLKAGRKELMGGEPHFLVELVGVDAAYQSQGIGKELTRRACEVADQRDAAIYLRTSAAKGYYVSKVDLGFEAHGNGDENGGTIIRARKPKRVDGAVK
ncbi:hypothetical protein LTR78_005350 [Recurvomyces mirabilis]|uniref:N-acetyltransferase domain-containing protein n=1 Tax=Recurvomyces mirabilis TaxID=574656 RepID=A0AAE0WN06_9PEZI|nr:hypothetical protein LTR78_005350 [Recurvomyces mirabilis]KAK5152743.1 hypothetical protein LTS14_008277 [Recurvomyces mirabilis]